MSLVSNESISTQTPPYAHSTSSLTMSPSIQAFLSFSCNSLLPCSSVPFANFSKSTSSSVNASGYRRIHFCTILLWLRSPFDHSMRRDVSVFCVAKNDLIIHSCRSLKCARSLRQYVWYWMRSSGGIHLCGTSWLDLIVPAKL